MLRGTTVYLILEPCEVLLGIFCGMLSLLNVH